MTHTEQEVIRRAKLVASWNADVYTSTSNTAMQELLNLRRAVEVMEREQRSLILVVEYDVTHLATDEIELLTGEAEAQAEATDSDDTHDGKPDVPVTSHLTTRTI